MSIVNLLDIPIWNVRIAEAIELLRDALCRPVQTEVFFVNAHCINVARRDDEYRRLLMNADYVFADGVGMRIAARSMGVRLVDNVNGTDLYPLLCASLEGTGTRMFLLGSAPGVAERVREYTLRNWPGLEISGVHHGYFDENEEEALIASIRRAGTDLLLVGMGVPRQEKWIARVLPATRVRVAMGVGGLFDVYSGKVWRPPMWMRRIGLEWMGRLVPGKGEPGRLWRRYLIGNVQFLVLVVRAAIKERRARLRDLSACDPGEDF